MKLSEFNNLNIKKFLSLNEEKIKKILNDKETIKRHIENNGVAFFELEKYISFGICYGIIHHKDYTDYNKNILIPISKNSDKYYFKYTSFKKEIEKSYFSEYPKMKYIEKETVLKRFENYFFNNTKLHSLSPQGIPSKYPLLFINVEIN